jgi:hypothetical protein
MLIQLKKGKDSRSTLACVRDDGSRTWGKVHPFFPEHDLTHYAVEGVLGFTEAFFGLVASGWELDDFLLPRTRSRLPMEALLAESIVGVLDMERGLKLSQDTDELNTVLADGLRAQGLSAERRLSEHELDAIRTLRDQLIARWHATAPGETLEVRFPPTLALNESTATR